ATGELTLREAIDKLVSKAKEGTLDPDDAEAAKWVMAGPEPTKVVADPKIVPNDLPAPTVSVAVDEKKILVKLPPRPKKLRRSKSDSVRWDYAAPPEPVAPEPRAPPLFSTEGLKPVATPT